MENVFVLFVYVSGASVTIGVPERPTSVISEGLLSNSSIDGWSRPKRALSGWFNGFCPGDSTESISVSENGKSFAITFTNRTNTPSPLMGTRFVAIETKSGRHSFSFLVDRHHDDEREATISPPTFTDKIFGSTDNCVVVSFFQGIPSTYLTNELPVNPGERISLKFKYATMPKGVAEFSIRYYRDTEFAWKEIAETKAILRSYGRWRIFEKDIVVPNVATSIMLTYSIRAGTEAWIDEISIKKKNP